MKRATVEALSFGKYQGVVLSDVPLGYLAWLIEDCDVSVAVARAVIDEITRRVEIFRARNWHDDCPDCERFETTRPLERWRLQACGRDKARPLAVIVREFSEKHGDPMPSCWGRAWAYLESKYQEPSR